MGKIFGYELKRTAGRWQFLALLAINAVFDWYVLVSEIIMGAGHTAPFSVWSCLVYLGKTMPAALAAVLALQAGYYGKKQKEADLLVLAGPVTPAGHFLIRTAVLTVCFGVVCLVAAVMAGVFYIWFFGYYGSVMLILPSLLIIVPCFVFAVSLGHLLGRVHPGLICVVMIVAAVAGSGIVTNGMDFSCAGYFAAVPAGLPAGAAGEPEFVMDTKWILARLLYLAAGSGMLLFYGYSCGRKASQDR